MTYQQYNFSKTCLKENNRHRCHCLAYTLNDKNDWNMHEIVN